MDIDVQCLLNCLGSLATIYLAIKAFLAKT